MARRESPTATPPARPSFIKPLLRWQVVGSLLGLAMVAGGIVAMSSMGGAPEAGPPLAASAPAQPAPVERVAVPVGTPVARTESVLSFTPADHSFSVNLPGLAEEVELSPDHVSRLADMDLHQYRLQVGERVYAIESADYREGAPPDVNAAMEAVQRTIVGNDSLLSSRSVPMRGATGRELRIRLGSGGERAVRYVFHGKKYAMVMITVPDGPASADQVDAFLNSFQLNSVPPAAM